MHTPGHNVVYCMHTGEKHMTVNVHRSNCVLYGLPFESANGQLLKLFHGLQSVEKQVRNSSTIIVFLIIVRSSDTLASNINCHLMFKIFLEPGSALESLF